MFSSLKRKLEAKENPSVSKRHQPLKEECSKLSTGISNLLQGQNETTSVAVAVEDSSRPFKEYISNSLWTKLHHHQHEAISFLVSRITAGEDTGAILADDMGTGKTCIGIMTSWIMVRSFQCKGLILCPAGLVNNWRSEIQRWLPESLGRTVIVLNAVNQSKGAKNLDLSVNRFITSHAVEHPLLVMSYDMFRIYAAALNTLPTLEFVICDEGHRIKGLDSKISLALNNCAAMRRIVMTGTPVQNNLLELFALVNFVLPGYLGEDLAAFRSRYEIGKEGSESQRRFAQQELTAKLQTLMLRRTKEQILSKILPPRHVRYIFTDFGYAGNGNFITNDPRDGNIAIPTTQENTYTECYEEASQCEQESKLAGKSLGQASMLPLFMKGRIICSCGSTNEESTQNGSITHSDRVQLLLANSTKLRFLHDLIGMIRSNRPHEKIVIASSFLSTLDAIKCLTMHMKWSSLRIDGSVSTDARHKILQLFNSTTVTSNNEPLFSILLLATKAGGEGLNLIAANHLVMMDIDWNPAVDAQTMGRIWRPGQKREVFIYRMIVPNTIEESILNRQMQKSTLQSVIQSQRIGDSNDDVESEETFEARSDEKAKNDENAFVDSDSNEDILISIQQQSMSKILRPRNISAQHLSVDSLDEDLLMRILHSEQKHTSTESKDDAIFRYDIKFYNLRKENDIDNSPRRLSSSFSAVNSVFHECNASLLWD